MHQIRRKDNVPSIILQIQQQIKHIDMSFSARYIEPNDLRHIWHLIRPGLLEVKEASNEAWIPEDVYSDCFAGRAMLWVTDEFDGFAVLQPQGETLHVWCGWGAWMMEDGFNFLFEIARKGGASKMSFDSNRPGWQKLAKKFGFKPRKWVAEV